MKLVHLVAVLGMFFLAASVAHAGSIIFQDTFETGPAGTPDLGSYILFSSPPENTIVDDGSGTNNVLESTGLTNNGFVIQTGFQLTQSVGVEYDFRVQRSGASLLGKNAIVQQMVLSPLPNNVSLYWADDGFLWTNTSGLISGAIPTPLQWSYDTDYHLNWTADAAADIVTIGISGLGTLQFGAANLGGGPFENYGSFALTRNIASTFTQHLDNLVITDRNAMATVPLPGAAWAGLGLLGILGAGRFVRRRRV